MDPHKSELQEDVKRESKKFEQHYLWIQKHLPEIFFQEVDHDTAILVAHTLMDFEVQEFFSHIHFKNKAIALCLDTQDSNRQILKHHRHHDIKSYRTFVSKEAPPFVGVKANLRVAVIDFAESNAKIPERLQILLATAKEKDPCQLKVSKNTLALAWKNISEKDLLYRLVQVTCRHGLQIKDIFALTVDGVLLAQFELQGTLDDDFLRELVSVKYFPGQELLEQTFVDTKLISGNLGNLLKTMVHFIHQVLVHADPYLYSFANIQEGLCRHPELTVMLTKAFEKKFHPQKQNLSDHNKIRTHFLNLVDKIDTGQEANDSRRRNILKQGLNFIDNTLKTNFYRPNKTAFSFRFDPIYMENVPYNRVDKFPELPFAIFFMKGMYFIGFHIRFRDLARGGLRTVFSVQMERFLADRNNIFSECYNLAYTQQKKNKDIPEGGAKGVILLQPHEGDWTQNLHESQRSYIESFVSLLNCDPDGELRAKSIVDYYKKPEYVYLGPDENMQNDMIDWITNYAQNYAYKPGRSFMSSKPGAGINHKEYGVTSRGVNIYMNEVLQFLNIDPKTDSFTIKMTGGPDGDVAGNQMANLYHFYPKTAQLLATVDVSGTIFDPQGLDLAIVYQLFKEGKPIGFYPPEKLSEGGFLLDIRANRQQSDNVQQTLLLRKHSGKIVEEWISGNEMNHLLRMNVHQVKTDIFVPGGGRPCTLNENNYKDFLDENGRPTSRAIVEGGNLYLSPSARRNLEKLGVIIIKDSSANKGGVICSSFEVLGGLVLSEKEFLAEKSSFAQDILTIIESRARDEARVLLSSHGTAFLTDVSDWISERINRYTDELMTYLFPLKLSQDPSDPLIRALLNYCPPSLRNKYETRILTEVPEVHKKAIIACFLAQRLVYRKGLDWSPSIVDVLPLIVDDPLITDP